MERAIEMILVTAAVMELDAQDSCVTVHLLRPETIQRRMVAQDLLDHAERRVTAPSFPSPFHP